MRQPARQRLLRILRTQSQSRKTQRMRGVMREMLEDAGMTVRVDNKQLFARKGNAEHMPVIVAHADTVHTIVPEDKYRVVFDQDKGQIVHHAVDPTTRQPRGVGGDDKCGLWIAQEIARNMDNVGVIITVDEEIGCIGARRVRKDQLAHATVLIQADRRGKDDAVIRAGGIDISSKEWQDHIKRTLGAHGYSNCTFGAGTDVVAMHNTGNADVSAVNLSAAYFQPHTANEYINEDDLENAFELSLMLAEISSGQRWTHEAKRHVYASQAHNWEPRSYRVYSNFFSDNFDARSAGYHATHLVRDSSTNRPSSPEWAFDKTIGGWVSDDREFIALYILGGIVMYTLPQFHDVASRIRKSGFIIKWDKTDHGIINDYLRDNITKDIREGPVCDIVEGCGKEAKVYHMLDLRWGCDEHIAKHMDERNERFLTPRPEPMITQITPAIPLDSGAYFQYD